MLWSRWPDPGRWTKGRGHYTVMAGSAKTIFRRKDEEVRKHAIIMIGRLQIKPGLKKLRRILADPELSTLLTIAKAALKQS